jgi:hypothetical protein
MQFLYIIHLLKQIDDVLHEWLCIKIIISFFVSGEDVKYDQEHKETFSLVTSHGDAICLDASSGRKGNVLDLQDISLTSCKRHTSQVYTLVLGKLF